MLITGVSGFVGQKLAARFLEAGHRVIGVDLRAGDFNFARHPEFQFYAADLTDPASVADLPFENVDLLYHLAAAGVKAATRQWPLCVRVNVMGTATLMQAFLQRVNQGQSVPRIVYAKTYYKDHLGAIPAFQENPYVVSKVAATRWVEALSAVYPQSITIAKVFQVYGPGDDPNNVLSYAARTLKAGEKATFGSGNSLRDWIYIDDFIADLIACGADHGIGLHRFDLGSGERHTIREMVELIAELAGADIRHHLSFIKHQTYENTPHRLRDSTELAVRRTHRPEFIEGPKSGFIGSHTLDRLLALNGRLAGKHGKLD